MARALDFISSSFESLTFGIWSRLGNRLALPVTPASPSDRVYFPARVDSHIISTIPDIFGVSRPQRLRLLYRGSRDGFQGRTFHNRCDGHPNTISLILSTNNCIFGGFTPVAWSSRNAPAPDPSLKSFIFTLKNPQNLDARIFKQKQADYAIYDFSSYGPSFCRNCDLYVCDQSQSSGSSFSNVGSGYVNDTGIAGNQVLTGSFNFTVKEIEVFEVI
jgi:hypothetical protein